KPKRKQSRIHPVKKNKNKPQQKKSQKHRAAKNQEKVTELYDGRITILSYTSGKEKVLAKCRDYGHEWQRRILNIERRCDGEVYRRVGTSWGKWCGVSRGMRRCLRGCV